MIKPTVKPPPPVKTVAPANLWARILAFFGRKPVQAPTFRYGDGTRWGDGHRWGP